MFSNIGTEFEVCIKQDLCLFWDLIRQVFMYIKICLFFHRAIYIDKHEWQWLPM